MDRKIKQDSSNSPSALARLFYEDDSAAGIWQKDELRAIFEHQLAAEIVPDAERLNAEFGRRARSAAGDPGLAFGEALLNPRCSLEIVKLVKDYAKIHWHSSRSGIPKEIVGALYYAAIAAALQRYSVRISRISNQSLCHGLDWVLKREWIPGSIKSICKIANDKVQSP